MLSLFLLTLYLLPSLVFAERPVVLWHGMGDDCCNVESMGRITALIQRHLGKDTFVHSVKIGDSLNDDHKAGFFGQIDQQLDKVCEELSKIPELKHGFNAIGFSQGGLFLRGYVQRCNQPSVHRLITFGSPHGGVSDIPNCINPKDFTCRLMRTMIHHGVYTDYVQNKVIQAQYYRDSSNIKGYLERNKFLPYLNNELIHKDNERYKNNLSSLNKFIMIQFSQDVMIKPAQTSWFWVDDEDNELVPLESQSLYQDDWLGLKKLNEAGRLEFLVCPGQHMQISDEYFEQQIIAKYLIDGNLQMIKQYRLN